MVFTYFTTSVYCAWVVHQNRKEQHKPETCVDIEEQGGQTVTMDEDSDREANVSDAGGGSCVSSLRVKKNRKVNYGLLPQHTDDAKYADATADVPSSSNSAAPTITVELESTCFSSCYSRFCCSSPSCCSSQENGDANDSDA